MLCPFGIDGQCLNGEIAGEEEENERARDPRPLLVTGS